MIAPNIQQPQYKKMGEVDGMFYNYRDLAGASRWKIKAMCPRCRQEYWLGEQSIRAKKTTMCKECAIDRLRARGKSHLGYKNGRTQKKNGYVDVLLDKDDPFIGMSITGNYVAEHRYVMAKKIGRPLKVSEHVHHINGIKNDNRIENLMLLDGNTHMIVTKLEQKIKRLEKRVKELES